MINTNEVLQGKGKRVIRSLLLIGLLTLSAPSDTTLATSAWSRLQLDERLSL
jgi:hypothetical protein